MNKHENAQTPAKTKKTRRKTAEVLSREFDRAAVRSQLSELVHLTALDEKLASGLYGLVDAAMQAAVNPKKPDSRLLRLIVRYSAARNRALASIHNRPQQPPRR